MGFKSVRVYNYRNLTDAEIDVDAGEIFLIGENGQGKTNFLESIYLLCYGSSFRTRTDREIIKIGETSMSVQGMSVTDLDNSVGVQIEAGKKRIHFNGKNISDRKQLIEHLPCIVFCHDDIDFVSGPPERRRWFFNQTMSLYNPLIIDLLRRYEKVIGMRNRTIRDGRVELLDIYDEQAASVGLDLQRRRGEAISLFNDTFGVLFHEVSGLNGDIRITYSPSWRDADSTERVVELLHQRRKVDIAFKTTTSGPHRDRIAFHLSGRDFARIASTGQRRLISLVLRVAQAKFFSCMTGRKPLLLLDDVLLELDAGRRRKFISLLPEYEQAFFTFLPDEHFDNYTSGNTMMYTVEEGVLTKEKPDMKKAADILRGILGDQEARQAGEWSTFFRGWQVLAGDDIAAHSSVKDVKQGTVIVEVDHPGWFQMLQMRKEKILKSIKKQYPELAIRDIRIYLGASAAASAAASAVQNGVPGTKPGNGRVEETTQAREELENTEEYQNFKKMLKRLNKGLS